MKATISKERLKEITDGLREETLLHLRIKLALLNSKNMKCKVREFDLGDSISLNLNEFKSFVKELDKVTKKELEEILDS